MKDGVEHHMNCAEGPWGRFRRTGASVTNSAGRRVCLAAGTSVRMLSVARFFISIYFLSASSVAVYRLTQQHQLWNAASYYALRSYIGFPWSQPTAFAWEPTRWQENQNADGFHIGSCVKSHCHIFLFRTQNGILSNLVSTNTWTSYRWSWGHVVCHKWNWLDFSSNLELAMQDHRPVKIRTPPSWPAPITSVSSSN